MKTTVRITLTGNADSGGEHRHTVVAAVPDADAMNEHANTVDTHTTASDAPLAAWLEMWNDDGAIARRICSDDFTIHFLNSGPDGSSPGDDVLGAESFAEFLLRWQEEHPDTVFTDVARAVDGVHGRMLWNMQVGESTESLKGGIDVFDFTGDGLIREVWSVGGTRSH